MDFEKDVADMREARDRDPWAGMEEVRDSDARTTELLRRTTEAIGLDHVIPVKIYKVGDDV